MNWNLKENTRLLIVVTSAISGAVGATAAYAASSKLLEKKFREIADNEIAEAKIYYQGLYSRPPMVEEPVSDEKLLVDIKTADAEIDGMPVRLVENALSALGRYSPEDDAPKEVRTEPQSERPAPTIVNVFAQHVVPGEAVVDALMANRDPAEPYIITKAEFFENDPEHEQKSFTFYEGDSVLVDDQDEYNPIDAVDAVAGDENLMRFGTGSNDENVVYVRNETLDPPMDLFITRSSGKYVVEVLAMDEGDGPHLAHSQRRFRLHDE